MKVGVQDVHHIALNIEVVHAHPAGVIAANRLDFYIVAALLAADNLQVTALVDTVFVQVRRAWAVMADCLVDGYLTAQF